MTPADSTNLVDVDPRHLDPDRPTHDEYRQRWARTWRPGEYEAVWRRRGASESEIVKIARLRVESRRDMKALQEFDAYRDRLLNKYVR